MLLRLEDKASRQPGLAAKLTPALFRLESRKLSLLVINPISISPLVLSPAKTSKTKSKSQQGNSLHRRLMKQATVHIHFVICPVGNGRRNPYLYGEPFAETALIERRVRCEE